MSGAFQRHNLPLQRTSLIGRADDVERLRSLVLAVEGRLLTVAGAGGCGKTRLALRAAEDVADAFPDGVRLVELASLTRPALMPRAVVAVFPIAEIPNQSPLDALVAYLESRRVLLVLDNCEHLLDACARLIEEVLDRCPDVRLLTTSRRSLLVPGEVVWRVPPLAVPSADDAMTAEQLMSVASGRLFVERAQAVQSVFELTDHTAPTIAKICQRLDGLPLAIELAAAQVRVIGVAQILDRMGQDVDLFADRGRLAPLRHQTLRATLDWSHALLGVEQQVLFRRLSVFVGDWSLEAAESICTDAGDPPHVYLSRLRRLVDLSLVDAHERQGYARYRLLEPTREYARELLIACGEFALTQRKHAMYFLELAESLEPGSRIGGPQRPLAQARLAQDDDNFRAAMQWYSDNGEADFGLRLANALALLWVVRGRLTEGLAWLQCFLALSERQPSTAARPLALAWAVQLAARQGNRAAARVLRAEGVATARTTGDQYVLHNMLQSAGIDAFESGEYSVARAYLEEALAVNRAAVATPNVRLCEASCLRNLGWVASLEGDLAAARAYCESGLAIARAIGDVFEIGNGLRSLARVFLYQSDLATARRLFEEGLAAGNEVGNRSVVALCQDGLGDVATAEGRRDEARMHLAAGLQGHRALGELSRVASSIESLAALSSALGEHDRAIRMAGAAEALRESIGAPLSPVGRSALEGWLGPLRQARGAGAITEVWAAGRMLCVEQAIELALTSAPRGAAGPSPASAGAAGLTRREAEVAALIAQGLTNRQIAETLVVSERTAEWHVARILDKLEMTSRAQIAVWVVQHQAELTLV